MFNIWQGLRLGASLVCIVMQQSGAQRLRDAIVFGFQLQRHPGRELNIPDWYGPNETKLGLLPARKSLDNIQGAVLPHEL